MLLAEKARDGHVVARLKWGDPVRVRQRREGSAVPARAGRRRSRSCPACRRPSARRPMPASRSPIRARATRSCSCAATRARSTRRPTSTGARSPRSTARSSATPARGSCRGCCTPLVEHGARPTTPAALIYRGTQPAQRTVTGTIGELLGGDGRRSGGAGRSGPAGRRRGRRALRDHLRWFDERPLFGRRIVVTRSPEQARGARRRARDAGRAGDRRARRSGSRRPRIRKPSIAPRRRSTSITGWSSSRPRR